MRHRVYGRHFGRDKNQRTSLFKSLVSALLTYGTIETTESKAKAIKGMVDKIINLAKDKNTQHLLQQFFVSKDLEQRLIKEVAPKLSDRNSGYTSLIRVGVRQGDRTMVVRMSLIGSEKMEPIKKESGIKNRELREETKKAEEKNNEVKASAKSSPRKPKVTEKAKKGSAK